MRRCMFSVFALGLCIGMLSGPLRSSASLPDQQVDGRAKALDDEHRVNLGLIDRVKALEGINLGLIDRVKALEDYCGTSKSEKHLRLSTLKVDRFVLTDPKGQD